MAEPVYNLGVPQATRDFIAGMRQPTTTTSGGSRYDKNPYGAKKPAAETEAERTAREAAEKAARDAAAAEEQSAGRALAIIRMTLEEWGLGALADWAVGQIASNRSPEEILIEIRNQDAYKQRFQGLVLRREKGLAPMSEQAYIEYENYWRDTARAYGLPSSFYDGPEDIADLVGNKDLSLPELQWRIETAYADVARAPKEVRDIFGEWFGAEGDVGLAMFFLDPDKAQPVLERFVGTGGIAGTARSIGISIDRARAERLVDRGQNRQSVVNPLTELFTRQAIFSETIGEQDDFTIEEEGVDAAFGLTEDAVNALDRRLEGRVATTRGGGGATIGRTATGFATADR